MRRNQTRGHKKRSRRTRRVQKGGDAFNNAMAALNPFTIILPEGTEIERVDTQGIQCDNPKFFSYFRSPITNPWINQKCDNSLCRIAKYVTNRPLRLLKLSYNIITMEANARNIQIANRLNALANVVYNSPNRQTYKYKNELNTPDNIKTNVKDIVRYNGSGRKKNSRPDWTLARLMCNAGFDGFIRLINPEDPAQTSGYDEITICNPNVKITLVGTPTCKAPDGSVHPVPSHFYKPLRNASGAVIKDSPDTCTGENIDRSDVEPLCDVV